VKPAFFEKLVRRRYAFRGRAVRMRVDTVRLPSGGEATREYMDHPGAVAVVPVLDGPASDPRILLVRQYRHPVGETTLELPAGKLDPGENPLACVKRELEEETGYKARRFQRLWSFWPTPAFANEVIHLYAARDLRRGRFRPDEDEFLEPAAFRLSQVLKKIERGLIKDSKTLVGLFAFLRRRK
jgi:ADP-ribose pyrophosphatase